MTPVRLSEVAHEHILMSALAFYGHVKPMVDLAVKIEKLKPTYITLLIADTLFDAVEKELSTQLHSHLDKGVHHFIRIIGMKCDKSPFDTATIERSFSSAYKSLASCRVVRQRPGSNVTTEALPAPRLVVVDLVGWKYLQAVRDHSGTSVTVLASQTSSAAQMFFASAPEVLGGRGDFADKVEKESVNQGISDLQLPSFAQKMWERADGRIFSGAGMPAMHDYEIYPQESCFDSSVSIAYLTRYMHKLFSNCDGIILNTGQSIEPMAIDAWKEWCDPRPVFALGPLASVEDSSFNEYNDSEENQSIHGEVHNFLENALLRHGQNSVVYISFGTVFWTTEPVKVWILLEVLVSLSMPFILAHASSVAIIPDDVRDRVRNSGLGILCKWAPQQFILGHSATGWFVSHCGQSSMLEALIEGVPMICWPFRGDQPFNAVTLSVNLNVAYELFEVRNGEHGLSPILRLGDRKPRGTIESLREEISEVLRKATGEDGSIKRGNVKMISEGIKESWSASGPHWESLAELLDFAGLK